MNRCTEEKFFVTELRITRKLLQEVNKLNIPCRNLISKGELEKSVVQTQRKYKNIIFGNYSRICKGYLKEL